jgi:hypothetical protein
MAAVPAFECRKDQRRKGTHPERRRMPIFISYSQKDTRFVDTLVRNLVAAKHHVWMDRWELSLVPRKPLPPSVYCPKFNPVVTPWFLRTYYGASGAPSLKQNPTFSRV